MNEEKRPDSVFTLQEAADFLGCHVEDVKNILEGWGVEVMHVGGVDYISDEEMCNYLWCQEGHWSGLIKEFYERWGEPALGKTGS